MKARALEREWEPDAALSLTQSATVQVPPSGTFNYTTVTIPSGVTITYVPNAANTPLNDSCHGRHNDQRLYRGGRPAWKQRGLWRIGWAWRFWNSLITSSITSSQRRYGRPFFILYSRRNNSPDHNPQRLSVIAP
jgi:hypothetical protein